MSTPSKAATPNAGAGRRPSAVPSKSQTTPARSPSRTANTSTTSSPATSNPARARSTRTGAGAGVPPSARAAVRKSVSQPSKGGMADNAAEEDAKAGAAAAMDDMRERLQKAELAVEEHMKQAAVLQARLDEANQEHSKLEESVHEQQERMEELENEKKESVRKRREMETIYEADQAAAMKEREEAQSREEELRSTVQRLKESMAQKELRGEDDRRAPDLSRTSSFRSNASPNPDASHFAPPSSLERSDSRSSSRLLLQKDKIIESLRLELAEGQIKIAELESIGGGRVQELEKSLLDARVTNARLMEDNESFQLLLAEKTISGDFASFLKPLSESGSRPPSRDAHNSSSLADELESATELDIVEHRKLISDCSTLRDQNKALSLYINNIISRLLQHKEFENILDKTPNLMSGSEVPVPNTQSAEANVNKDLPPPPEGGETAPPSLLQRATSVVRGRPRPQTLNQPSSLADVNPIASPTMTEDPTTAPRVPIGRPQVTRVSSGSHRRANSEWSHATVVGNMYRGPSPASGQISPGIAPQRASTFFSAIPASNSNPAAAARMPSGSSVPRFTNDENKRESMQAPPSNRDSKISSSRNSMVSEPDNSSSSPPRSTISSTEKPSGAIMGGNKMRPLRLVQEANEQEEAQKKANRTSWMGWFNKGGPPKAGGVEGE